MKKIIIAALSMILGSFGYVIVDSTIENRVNNLESSYSVLQEQFSSHCEAYPFEEEPAYSETESPETEAPETEITYTEPMTRMPEVNDYLNFDGLQRLYKVLLCYNGEYYIKYAGDDDSDSDLTTYATTTQIDWESTTALTTAFNDENEEITSQTVKDDDLLGTNNCIPGTTPVALYDVRFDRGTAQIVSKAQRNNETYESYTAVTEYGGNDYGIKFVFEGKTNTSLAGKKIHIKGYVYGNYDNHQYDVWSTVNEDGTFRIESTEIFYYPEHYFPFGLILCNISFE